MTHAPRRLQMIPNGKSYRGYFQVVSRRFHLSKMYIMSQSLLGYFRIDTLLPSAPTSETDDDTPVKPRVMGVESDVSPPPPPDYGAHVPCSLWYVRLP